MNAAPAKTASVSELFKANYAPAINLLSAKRRSLGSKEK